MNDEKIKNFDNEKLEEIWRKAEIIIGVNPKYIRRDIYGNWIRKNDYNNFHSSFGWIAQTVKMQDFEEAEFYEKITPVHWKNKK